MDQSAFPTPSADATFAALVVDSRADAGVRHFRSTVSPEGTPVDRGFVGLHASGSAQFSREGWRQIRALLGRVPDAQLYVVDLREESHAFVAGNAVSWYALENWSCAGLSPIEVDAIESVRVRLLQESESLQVTSADAIKMGKAPVYETWLGGDARRESAELGLAAGHYVRLPVTDHAAPRAAVVDDFVRFVRETGGQPHLHFHCRGGRGRTALFMAMLDMLSNATEAPFDAIVARHDALSAYDLMGVPEDNRLRKAPFIAARCTFLRIFYAYARDRGVAPRASFADFVASQ
jgi:protein-tyrosine phosphatase